MNIIFRGFNTVFYFPFIQPQETVTIPIPDALTRLWSRPRLHVTATVTTTAAPAANSNNRRHLVPSLLSQETPPQPNPKN